MALTIRELMGMSQASSGDYRQGLGKKSCCASCAHGGPCTGCGGPAGAPCRCHGGMGGYVRTEDYQKFLAMKRAGQEWEPPSASQFSPAFSGLGATTVVGGQADLEPGDYGYQYAQTTKPNTTVVGRRQGFVNPGRRVAITQLVAQAEYLAGTPGVHPRVLAQKVWEARKALMGTSRWEWANYQTDRQSYDSYDDLVARLEAVERVLGVDKVSPKLMSQLYGSGMGGLGYYTGPEWLSSMDPVSKLASCIRGAICVPKSFCCPPGTCFEDPGYMPPPEPYYEDYPEYYDEYPGAPPPPPPGGSWIGGDPGGTLVDMVQPKIAIGQDPKLVQPEPKEQIALVSPTPWVSPGGTQVALPGPTVVQKAPAPQTAIALPSPTVVQKAPAPTVQAAPKPISIAMTSPSIQQAVTSPTPQPYAQQAQQYRMPTASRGGMVVGGGALAPAGATAFALAGLGATASARANSSLKRLAAQLRAAREQARRSGRR